MNSVSSYHVPYWLKYSILLLVWPLMGSCSFIQITYSTADWILMWKLDGYFDLTATQEEFLNDEVKKLHDWHREDQLPRYAQFLKHIHLSWKEGLTNTDIKAVFASIESFRGSLAEHASKPGAIFLSTVTPAQVRHLQQELDQEHRKLTSEIGSDLHTRVQKRIESVVETLTFWVGKLSSDQEASIRQWIEEIPDISDMWLASRKRRQALLLGMLRASPDPYTLEQDLYRWLADPRAGATAEYLITLNKWRQDVEEVIVKIDRTLTTQQRAHLSRKLHRLIRDIQKLGGRHNTIPSGV